MSEGARQFRCEVQTDPPVVSVFGDVDIDSCDALAAEVRGLMAGRDGEPLVLDLAGVTFLDSSGLTVLAGALNAGHPVTVRNPSRVVRTIIEATGLAELVRLEP